MGCFVAVCSSATICELEDDGIGTKWALESE